MERFGLTRDWIMNINPLQRLLTLDLRSSGSRLQAGTELQAVVRQNAAGQLQLELASGERLTPRSSVPLRSGELLQLRVSQTEPVVVLQIISRQPDATAIDAALRTLLASAGSRLPLADSLTRLLTMATQARSLPPPLEQLLGALTARLRTPAQLTDPGQLAQALRDSGLFLEQRLAATPGQPPAQDFKAQLLRLATWLRQALDEAPADRERPLFSSLAESSGRLLSRLETLQLHAASTDRLDLLFELPLRVGTELDHLQLRIQDEPEPAQEQAEPGEPGLLVRLRFEFAATGAVGAVLRLSKTDINVHWWAERPALAARLREALPMLAGRLEALGLRVGDLTCLDGAPPAIDDLPILRTRGLLHEKA